jgi:anti-sigma B factor antagonist
LELSHRRLDQGTVVVDMAGELHVSTAQHAQRALEGALPSGPAAVVLDLSEVEFIDSTGLSILLNALRRVTRGGGRLAVVCTNPTVLRLFEITRLEDTFDIQPTREAALRRVGYDPAGGNTDGAP